MAEEDYFDCREKAEGRRKKLSRTWPRTDIMVVEYAVDVRPLEDRLQFDHMISEGTIDMESVPGEFEEFWQQESLHQTDHIVWYEGEMLALMGTALYVAEDRQSRDVNSHATRWTQQILQECRHSVHAELFCRAAEVGIKALVVAESGSRTATRKLGYNLQTV